MKSADYSKQMSDRLVRQANQRVAKLYRMPSAAQQLSIAIILLLASCSHITKRGQSPETESMEFRDQPFEVQYIGDVSGPWGLEKLKVDGLALITQLDGTGSDPPASSQRDYLIAEIKTHNIDNIAELLADKNNSMASIRGFIPAAAKKGDRFDIEVECFNPKTTSLEGGYLMQARMKPMLATRRSVQLGHDVALAGGRVLVNALFESKSDKSNLTRGWVIGGGVVMKDRTTGLRIIEDQQSVKLSRAIARSVNDRFSTRDRGGPIGVAEAKTDKDLKILIPDDYRHNIGRYLHVIMNIAFNENPQDRINRLEWLERELYEPSRSSLAAIRLEAIGNEAIPALKRGLRSDDIQVRFHAAQALAYMGDSSGVQQLKNAIVDEPAFRWHGLTALATLRSSASEAALVSLLNVVSAETRYGAFRALRESRPGNLAIGGKLVAGEFMLHELNTDVRPMVHFSKTKRQEVVLFGNDQKFNSRLIYVKSGLTVKALDESRIQFQLYLPRQQEKKIVSSSRVSDVIDVMASLGYDYGDVLTLMKEAKRVGAFESQLVINAVPQLSNSYRQVGLSGSVSESSDRFIAEPMPDMFDDSPDTADSPDGSSASSDPSPATDWKGIFGRMKNLWSR